VGAPHVRDRLLGVARSAAPGEDADARLRMEQLAQPIPVERTVCGEAGPDDLGWLGWGGRLIRGRSSVSRFRRKGFVSDS